MKMTRHLDYRSFYKPSELREYVSNFTDNSVFYEWFDGPDIPGYATSGYLTDKKGIIEEIEYWEEQKPDSEDYEKCSFTEYAYLGEEPIFSADYVSECLEEYGYNYLAKRIGDYGFVTMGRILSLYKVFGLYEKGKENPYSIVCCLEKPEKECLEDNRDLIKIISLHATISDFESIDSFLKKLKEDISCSPIALYEDDGNSYCVYEIQDESPTYIQPSRPQLIKRTRKGWFLTKESKAILDNYDNANPFGWLCFMRKTYYMKSSSSERIALAMTKEDALKKGQQKAKRRVIERGEKEKSFYCIPVTESAYCALKDDLNYHYIHSTRISDGTELIVFDGEKEYRFP